MIKSIPFVVGLTAAVALASPLEAQGFEGIMDVRSSSMPPQASMLYYVKGDRIRLEISAPGQSQIVMISDGPSKKQYVLFLAQKVYAVTTFAELMRASDSLRKESAALMKNGSMTPLGTTTKVAGVSCQLHRYRDANSVYNICLTTQFGAVGGLSGLFGNIGKSADATEPPAWAQKYLKAGSFALRLADTTGKMIWEVNRAQPKTLDSSLFAPPADFTVLPDSLNPGKRPPG